MAEATRQQEILVAEGQSRAIENIFGAIHVGKPTSELLMYQYLLTLQKMADGQATKIVVPYEVGSLMGLATSLSEILKTPSTEKKNWGMIISPMKLAPAMINQTMIVAVSTIY